MQKLRQYWDARSGGQRAILAAAFLATFLGIVGFAWMANRTPMALLYAGLDGTSAGAIVTEIEKSGLKYEIRGDSIWIDAKSRDQMRMTLAGQGLPSAGAAGYEILDGMSGFGTTSQMFDAAYWRAKEGELARTILSIPHVRSARVHIAVPARRGSRAAEGGSASVTLTTDGSPIDRAQARAMAFLVSSGVPGLTAAQVTIIDGARGIVAADDALTPQDRADEIKRNVERILEPHVGIGNAIVEAHLDIVTEAEQLTEQRFDPNQRALISQESEESTGQSQNQAQGAVTAASNLPDNAPSKGDESRSTSSETRQRSNFEVSRTVREVTRQPGATRRMTVAVLVNGTMQTDAQGASTLAPRPEAELQTLRELVASAVGFEEERGDVVTVKSLPFASLSDDGTTASQGGILSSLDANGLARLGIIGLVVLALAFMSLRGLKKPLPPAMPTALDGSTGATTPALAAPAPVPIAEVDMRGGTSLATAIPDFDFPATTIATDPVARLRELMRERKSESLQLLNGWIAEKESA
ncbi:MAG: flagellar M-ring protein FliF [Paracoccus denitrificans]|nr:MAG: flagellar M-ring protein FliF [Paracoccus denitrificans]PZO85469.1 MAG: flagellar M-ring protein FliF [Paracoccus denitrificans]